MSVTQKEIDFLKDLREVLVKHNMEIESGADAADDQGLYSWIVVTTTKDTPNARWPNRRYDFIKTEELSPSWIDSHLKEIEI